MVGIPLLLCNLSACHFLAEFVQFNLERTSHCVHLNLLFTGSIQATFLGSFAFQFNIIELHIHKRDLKISFVC